MARCNEACRSATNEQLSRWPVLRCAAAAGTRALAVKRAIRTPQVNPIRSFRLAIMRGNSRSAARDGSKLLGVESRRNMAPLKNYPLEECIALRVSTTLFFSDMIDLRAGQAPIHNFTQKPLIP